MSTNATLAARHRDAIPRGVSCATLVYPQRAENAEVWDVEGRRYLDFAAGIAVLNVGHRHPRIIAAVQEQLSRFTHTAFQVLPYEGYVELAERLNGLAPIAGKAKTLFFTTGAEAAENAVKIARAATGRSGVIAFAGGFHGRSVYASALTGKVSPYKAPFGPMPAGVFHAPFPSEETGVTVEASLAMLDFIFRADIAPADVAAIIIEPVQGEGGFHIASTEFLRALRAICDTHGIMLIADEVQTGFARTGKMFAIEHSGVSPDLVSMAKSLGGGFPIAAVTGRAEIMDAVPPGGLGGTYAGSPVACAAALAVLDVIEAENLCARANAIGARSVARLRSFATRNDLASIVAIRTLGAMTAFDLVGDPARDVSPATAVNALRQHALEAGLIILSCGAEGQTVRLLAPLTIDDALLDEGLDMLETALRKVAAA
ncbi:MAG: 4-aminobutyrate--2-oxoglutarate transaminase [Sphingomonadales bacterium]|nr:4-aminobutyrate--2-oxoglutarate transaminase [Sphingomonadales bacterium]